jgi:hypothetical protein
MSAMARPLVLLALAAAAGLSPVPAARAQGGASYEPQQRLRTALDTCLKTEVQRGAYCVRKCAADFRMDLSGAKPRCIATKANATYEPPVPGYRPPARTPGAPKAPGA